MSSRSKFWGVCRTLTRRSVSAAPNQRPVVQVSNRRWYSDEPRNNQPSQAPSATNASDFLRPDKSASIPSIPGEDGTIVPGTEHIETLNDEELSRIFYGGNVTPKEGDPGLTEAQQETLFNEGRIIAADQAEVIAAGDGQELVQGAPETPGFKFPLPTGPFPSDFNHKKRYHPVLDQLTRLMMRHGKLSAAQRNMATVMNYLRTSPAPIYSPKFPLLPGTPPASHLPLNPVLYITIAIDSVAPLIRISQIKGAAGGGRALDVPKPLGMWSRRRFAFKWILDAVEKKPSKGSGQKQFPYRVAEEIIAVVEGRSSVWDRRKVIHKQGTVARVNAGSEAKGKVNKRR